MYKVVYFSSMHTIKKAFFFLFAMTAIVFAQDAIESDSIKSLPYSDSLKAEQLALDTRLDYSETYVNLINQEEKNISRSTSLAILGGSLIGFGGLMTGIYIHDGVDSDGQESLGEAIKVELLICSIGLTIVGTVGLTYNLYALFNKDGYYNKRDAYKRGYDIYKRRREEQDSGPKIALIPTLDIEKSGAGLNVSLLF